MSNERDEPAPLFPDDLDGLSIDDEDDEEETTEQDQHEDSRPTDGRMSGAPTENDSRTGTSESDDEESFSGLIEDGLTTNETILLLGMTIASYTFAWGVLVIMVDEGLQSAPLTLWGVFGLLVCVPLLALFGTGFSNKLTDLIGR